MDWYIAYPRVRPYSIIIIKKYIMLCFRLEAYDRNHNFGKNDEPEPEYYMTLPDPGL